MNHRTAFVLGAGFSRHAGLPLVIELRQLVFQWIERNKEDDFRIKPHMYPMQNWPEFPRGKFQAGLEYVDKGQGFEELLIALQAAEDSYPATVQTIHVLQRACVRLLLERQRGCKLPGGYLHFADHVAQATGVISFNWDLVCEQALHQSGIPWSYAPNFKLPIIKPHGSMNWVNHLQARDGRVITNPPDFAPIGPDMTISWEPANPFSDPLFAYDGDDLRHILFPGDPEMPGSERGGTARKDAETLWQATEDLIGRSTQIVFIGYSLPIYDRYTKELLQRACRGKQIIVCNPSEEAIRNFQSLFIGEQVLKEQFKFEESRYARAMQR